MIKVLHIMPGADAGGISAVVLNYYKYFDRTQFHFDIALTTDMIGQNGKELQKLGANIYKIPLKSKGIKSYKEAIKRLLIENNYDAVHVHENETSYVALSIAKKLGIRCRIAHSHTTAPFMSLRGELRRLSGIILNSYYSTTMIGCCQLAGERIFGNYNMKKSKAIVLPNAIETDKFSYNENIRLEVREELKVQDKFVVGMVGRIDLQKNNIYAIEIFKYIYKQIPNAVLIIVGDGPWKEKLLNAINNSGISQNIKYLGKRKDVVRLYQAFDVFFMPSLYEGFPVAAVEAMSTGLPILMSDRITKELNFYEAVHYMPLEDKKMWATIAAKYCNDSNINRKKRQVQARYNGFDISDSVQILQNVYFVDCNSY